jgi:hypothetical protein
MKHPHYTSPRAAQSKTREQLEQEALAFIRQRLDAPKPRRVLPTIN